MACSRRSIAAAATAAVPALLAAVQAAAQGAGRSAEPPSGPLYWAWIVGMVVVTAIALVALAPWVRDMYLRWKNRK